MKIKYISKYVAELPEAYYDGIGVIVPKLEDESLLMYMERIQSWIRYFKAKKEPANDKK